MTTQRGPLTGLFAHPCGVWVRVETDERGIGWRRLLLRCTRRGVLGVNESIGWANQ